jgi:hypothetical protein
MYSMGQPRRPYNSNWLTEFTQQNKQKMDAQNVMAMQLYGQPSPSQSQQGGYDFLGGGYGTSTANPQGGGDLLGGSYGTSTAMPNASLMSRYLKENNPSNSPMGSAVNEASTQPMDYTPKNYMAANAESPQAPPQGGGNFMGAGVGVSTAMPKNDYTDFTDEGGETFKIKKQPKPAYDWSQDFG